MKYRRKGASLPSLSGKSAIEIVGADANSSVISYQVAPKELHQADVYANTIGSIYEFKEGQYGEGHTGQIYFWDIPSGGTGFYGNRL